MKGNKKGLKFGGKKNDLDAFIEAEFSKIKKPADAPIYGQQDFGDEDGGGEQQYEQPVYRPGMNQGPISQGEIQMIPSKKPTTSKPVFALKKAVVKRQNDVTPQQNVYSGGMQLEESLNDNPQYGIPAPQRQVQMNPIGQPIGSNTGSGEKGKAILPAHIKPIKIQKKKFQMALPDEKQAGFNFKAKIEEDVVESLADNDPNSRFGNQRSSQPQNDRKPIVQQKQLGPQVMITKVKEGLNNPTSKLNQSKIKNDDSDNYDDDNYDNDFEDDQGQDNAEDKLDKLRKAMEREKNRAMKHKEKVETEQIVVPKSSQYQNANSGPNMRAHSPSQPSQLQQQPDHKPPAKHLEGFAKAKGLIVGERVDHVAANLQLVRAEELRELVDLGQEEYFNMFEMVPQTPQDVYFSKLTSGTLKTAIVSCSDDLIDKDVQTEDLGYENKFNQAPEDVMTNYNKVKPGQTQTYQRKKKRENEALNLEKFMSRAGPVMESRLSTEEKCSRTKIDFNISDRNFDNIWSGRIRFKTRKDNLSSYV